MTSDDEKPTPPTAPWLPIGVALGTSIGTAIGLSIDNLGLGLGVGVALGCSFGTVMSAAQRTKSDKEVEE